MNRVPFDAIPDLFAARRSRRVAVAAALAAAVSGRNLARAKTTGKRPGGLRAQGEGGDGAAGASVFGGIGADLSAGDGAPGGDGGDGIGDASAGGGERGKGRRRRRGNRRA